MLKLLPFLCYETNGEGDSRAVKGGTDTQNVHLTQVSITISTNLAAKE
jgi:hypothetical protein